MGLNGKKVTVVGLGNSGLNAAILLDDIGARVRVTDSSDNPDTRANVERLEHRDIEIEVGGHTKDFFEGSGLVVLSPGVDDSSPAVKWASELKIPIISEVELGYRYCKGEIIAVTGTNGKSTVTALTGEMLKAAGRRVFVCGNIGNALSGEVGKIRPGDWVVLEVSSFQLERVQEFKPRVAVILNVTDDHQDRYRSMKRYFDEKMRIFANQDEGDALILNYDAANLRGVKEKARPKVYFYSRLEEVRGAFARGGGIYINIGGAAREAASIGDIALKGVHNIENAMACCLAATLAGADADSIKKALKGFRGLEHRIQPIDTIDGVEYMDDSKSTTVDSTVRALESFPSRRVLLIAGGRDKNSDFSAARDTVADKVKALILIGEAKEKLKGVLAGAAATYTADTMKGAVEEARRLAKAGDCVLLSPMCASFDMFKNYKERGEVFQAAVRGLKR